jgi:hypothetical protein
MKRIPTIMFPEVLDSLESLSNEEIGQMMRLIIRWNKGESVEPQNSLEKFAWATILPKLERDKERYQDISEKRREAVNKRWDKQKDTNVYKCIQDNTTNTNSSYNYNNTSKEVLFDIQQPYSSEDESVVSKGLESLEKIFPQGRNYIGIDEVNLWNKLSQQEKQVMIKRGSMYIRNEKKKDDGKYIKGIGKWMREQVEKGFEEQMPSMKNKTSSDDPRLLKLTDGNLYAILLSKTNNSSKMADKLYYLLNRKEMFSSKEELSTFVRNLNQEEINDLIN